MLSSWLKSGLSKLNLLLNLTQRSYWIVKTIRDDSWSWILVSIHHSFNSFCPQIYFSSRLSFTLEKHKTSIDKRYFVNISSGHEYLNFIFDQNEKYWLVIRWWIELLNNLLSSIVRMFIHECMNFIGRPHTTKARLK